MEGENSPKLFSDFLMHVYKHIHNIFKKERLTSVPCSRTEARPFKVPLKDTSKAENKQLVPSVSPGSS